MKSKGILSSDLREPEAYMNIPVASHLWFVLFLHFQGEKRPSLYPVLSYFQICFVRSSQIA